MNPAPVIYLVDDDPTVLKSLRWMIGSEHEDIETFSSGVEFLASYDGISHGCVILDMRMPEVTGLEVQARLAERGVDIPVIVLTGHGDIPICTKSFRAGAFDFIVKPADSKLLLERIAAAIADDEQRFQHRLQLAELKRRMASLTARERDVIRLIVDGKTLKQIAFALEIGIQTVAKHRARALEKLQVGNDVELVHAALRLPF